MLSSLFLSLREGLEAALVIGIVLATLKKIKRPVLIRWVWAGAVSAGLLAVVIGVLLNQIGISLEGKAEQLFEGFTLLAAAGLLTWMVLWMQRRSRGLQQEMESRVSLTLTRSARLGIFSLIFFAVLREGLELALFLLAVRFNAGQMNVLVGVLLGLGLSALLGWVFFTLSERLTLRGFFQVTNTLLILFAAGLVGLAVHEFNEAGWIPAVIDPVWDLSPILDEGSTLGGILKALFGYQANPSLSSIISYIGYLIAIGFAFLDSKKKSRALRAD